MKTLLSRKAMALFVGAALTLSTTAVRADDDTQTTHHHRHHRDTAPKTVGGTGVKKVAGSTTAIPTRDDRGSQEVRGGVTGGANGQEYRVPTGSNLPKQYDRKAHDTNLSSNRFIYDQNDQRLQESNSVGNSLRSVPGVTVLGARGL